MRRAGLIFALGAVIAAWPGASALGADKNVTANTDSTDVSTFNPANVTVLVGDTVHWHNNSGKHNVHFGAPINRRIGGDPVAHSSTSTHWDAQFTFNNAGTFKYWCDEHSDGTFGMIGKVVVQDPNAPPKISGLTAKPSAFCTNRSATCDQRGTKIKFTLSKAAKVTGQIKPKDGSKPFKVIFSAKPKPAGKNSINYAGKGLKPAKYILRLQATDSGGHVSQWVKTTVRVVKNG
jgi:plastocyanin